MFKIGDEVQFRDLDNPSQPAGGVGKIVESLRGNQWIVELDNSYEVQAHESELIHAD